MNTYNLKIIETFDEEKFNTELFINVINSPYNLVYSSSLDEKIINFYNYSCDRNNGLTLCRSHRRVYEVYKTNPFTMKEEYLNLVVSEKEKTVPFNYYKEQFFKCFIDRLLLHNNLYINYNSAHYKVVKTMRTFIGNMNVRKIPILINKDKEVFYFNINTSDNANSEVFYYNFKPIANHIKTFGKTYVIVKPVFFTIDTKDFKIFRDNIFKLGVKIIIDNSQLPDTMYCEIDYAEK